MRIFFYINHYYMLVFIIIVILIIYVIYYWYNYDNMTFLKSNIDNKYYMVRNLPDKIIACNMLATLRNNILKLKQELISKKNDEYLSYKEYIEQLANRVNDVTISENNNKDNTTSYSVNKGEELIVCLRSKKEINKFHEMNTLMYVILHEISHIACPEYNHTPLFKKIFAFFTEVAVKLNIYQKVNYEASPVEYCGIYITDSIV